MPTALIIGDSHVHATAFGSALESQLKAAGWDVTRAGVGATSSRSWTNGHPCTPNKSKCVDVADLPKGTDLLLISLGTNDGANAAVGGKTDQAAYADGVADRIAELARTFWAKRTIWILPPWQRGSVKWYTQDAMEYVYAAAPKAAAAGVELFDSRPSTEELVKGGSGDGVHPSSKCAKQWASAVVEQVQGTSSSGLATNSGASSLLVIAGVAAAALLVLLMITKRK